METTTEEKPKAKHNPFISPYSEEEKNYIVEVMTRHMNKKGRPSWAESIRTIEKERPGLLRGKDYRSQSVFLSILWKKRGPQAVMEQRFEERISELKTDISRTDLIGMMKIKAQEFMIRDYDNLKPGEKFKIVGDVIKADYNEEKLQIEKDKLRANKRMMDSLMGSLMSGDMQAVLSKYEVQLQAPKNMITLDATKQEEEDGALPGTATPAQTIPAN